MKLCKRLVLVGIAVLLLAALSGCIIIPLSKYYRISPDEVESIQFYDLRTEELDNSSLFYTTCDPAYTLPEEENAAFLKDFSKLRFSDTIVITLAAMDLSFAYGDWVIRINFSNGQYAFYSCASYGATYNADGTKISSNHFGCRDDDLENLIGKYFSIE